MIQRLKRPNASQLQVLLWRWKYISENRRKHEYSAKGKKFVLKIRIKNLNFREKTVSGPPGDSSKKEFKKFESVRKN